MSIAVTSDDLPISKVDEYVESYIAPRISRIPGVGLVDYHGQQKPAIRVQIRIGDDDVLRARVAQRVGVINRPDLGRRNPSDRRQRANRRNASDKAGSAGQTNYNAVGFSQIVGAQHDCVCCY
jgi:hypothetical protein